MDTQITNLPVVAVLYKLQVGEKWYVGSTSDGVGDRMKAHYRQGSLTPDRKLYKAVAEAGGWDKIVMTIIETKIFQTPDEVLTYENTFIKLDDPNCLNSVRAILTPAERKDQINKAKRKSWAKMKEDPEWMAKKREKANEIYARSKENPEWMAKNRVKALQSYYRRKALKD